MWVYTVSLGHVSGYGRDTHTPMLGGRQTLEVLSLWVLTDIIKDNGSCVMFQVQPSIVNGHSRCHYMPLGQVE